MKNPFKKNSKPDNYQDVSPTPPKVNNSYKNPKNKGLYSTIALLVTAPLLAILITSHVFHSYEVDGQSMSETLQNGDRLVVYKLPKTISNIFDSTYMPNRYDIIVFDRPGQIGGGSNTGHLIKRVIALPGERVTVKDGDVKVYNTENPDGFDPDKDQEYSQSITTTPGSVDITVGLGEVFVLGDNRTNSTDSRVFGSFSTEAVVGEATIRFIPVNEMRTF